MTDTVQEPSTRRQQIRELTRRAGWNMGDQVVSSATNLVLSFLVARSLSADGFGAFAVAFTIYTFFISAARALISQPLIVRYTSEGPEQFRANARFASGAAVNLGIAGGVITAASGFFLDGALGSSLICIGVLLPGLVLQDMWRQIFVAEGRPAAAFVNDVVWGVVQLGAVAAFILLDRQSSASMLLGWGGAALIAAVLGIVQFGASPRLRASFGWFGRQRDLVGYYAASFLSVMGANQITTLLIAALGEPADVGALRAAQVVLGPLNIAGYTLWAFALPELSRRQLSGSTAIKVAAGVSGVMVLADLVWGGLLLAMPSSLGAALLGDSWTNAQAVLPASLLGLVAIGLGFGANMLMVARGFAKESFWISTLLAPGFLIFGLGGLHFWGAPGAALGLSLAQCVVVPVTWWRIIVLMRREARMSTSEADGTAT